jgi:hypothetical protein
MKPNSVAPSTPARAAAREIDRLVERYVKPYYSEQARHEIAAILDRHFPSREPQGAQWRPMQEGVPEINLAVLTFLSDGSQETNWYLPAGKWYQRYGDREVTHWMPLPDPPVARAERVREQKEG